MTYTPDVPQANQQIAATQGPILANFTFIQADAQVEHIFNGNTGPLGAAQLEGTHIQTSMPNQNLLAGPLPTGTNGVYYVNDGKATFYDGTNNYTISQSQATHGQSSISSSVPVQILPFGNYFGIINLRPQGQAIAVLQFLMTYTPGSPPTFTISTSRIDPGSTVFCQVQLDGSGNLQLRTISGSLTLVTWQVLYTLVP
jgi:hypothetical protein